MPVPVPLRLTILTIFAALCFGQDLSDPWSKPALLEPAILAQELSLAKKPVVIVVAFPVLYRSKKIPGALEAGPGSKPEGIALLRRAVAGMSKDAPLVIYCGCCPMVKCPNIRPAFRVLKEMGFTNVRVLSIPTNMHADWYSKGYPSEAGSGPQAGQP